MSESSITPLAQRLAEENNVDWESLQGSGPEGRIIERDVLEYLARVMAGEEALNPTPEPLPDGLDSWDSFESAQETETWFRPPEPVAAEAVPVEPDTLEQVAEPVVTGSAADQYDAPEAEFELSDDIFLFDEDGDGEADETALQIPADDPELSPGDSFDLFGEAGSPAADSFTEADGTEGLLDDDFYEDDFLTDLALEDGELDSPETADVDLTGFGMLGDTFGAAPAADETDLLTGGFGDESSFLDERDDDLWATGAAVEGTPGSGWQEEAVPHSLAHYLQHETAAETAETGNPRQFSLDEAEDDAELALLTGYTDLDRTTDLGEAGEVLAGEESFEVDFSELGSPDEAEADTDYGFDQPVPVPLPAALPTAEPLPTELPPASLPLVSHGALLRRHADLTLLAQARQAAGAELRQGEPASALPFLLRAAARSAHLLNSAAQEADTVVTGAALITEHGVNVQLVSDAAQGSFAGLIRLLATGQEYPGTEQAGMESTGAVVIACDVSELELDEAVLHLDSPLLTLGRILSDSEQGTHHSTLTLSGTFEVAAGARFLQAVSELLASPVRLLI